MLIIGELLKQADLYISEGLHPRIVSEGFDKAKVKALQVNLGYSGTHDAPVKSRLLWVVKFCGIFALLACYIVIVVGIKETARCGGGGGGGEAFINPA